MRYRRFGQTDFELSVFSLGTMRFADYAAAEATITQAIAQGINHLETARGYGDSERFVGQALAQSWQKLELARDRLYITTKLSPTADAATFQRHLRDSLERLQLDYVDGLALHGINRPEHLAAALSPDGALAAAEQAQQQGLVRQIGFSTHGDLPLILQILETRRFAFMNLHYYYFFQRHAPAIARAQALDMGIFIISPTDKGGQLYNPPAKLRQLCTPFAPQALNYRFLLSDPRITTLSLGAAGPEELSEALSLADQTGPLSEAEQSALGRLAAEQDRTLGADACRQCYACLPCPEQIQIPEVLRLRNLAIAYDMQSFGEYRYAMFEKAGHWFPGRRANHCTDCGDCLPRCPEQLDIPRLLRETHNQLKGRERRRLWGHLLP